MTDVGSLRDKRCVEEMMSNLGIKGCTIAVSLCSRAGSILLYMTEEGALTRSLIRRAENTELSLGSLEAIAEIRRHLGELETEAIKSARDKGATVDDIAEAIGLTPQAIYHRLRSGGQPAKRGRPRSAVSEPNDESVGRAP